jgi:hypothetical protein
VSNKPEATNGQAPPRAPIGAAMKNFRPLENFLVGYFSRLNIPLANGGGTAFVEVVTRRTPGDVDHGDDVEVTWLSVEDLARKLTEELSR